MTSTATHPTWMDFLEASFGDAVSHARRVAVVGLPGPRTRLCGSLDEARSAIASLSHAHDVFTGVGLVDCGGAGTPKGRGTASDVCAIGCLWADIDLAGGVHANERLPRNEDDVRRILERVWATPTAIVRSGHGVHAYWMLSETWVFEGEDDRRRAASIAKAWHGRVCDAAASLGFRLENLGDLSRVLRVPGTVNRKDPDDPQPCEFLECDLTRRHHLADLEELLPPEVLEAQLGSHDEPSGAAHGPVEAISLSEGAEPPVHMCVSLAARSELFRRTWLRDRSDLRDTSASAYDLSLATIACLAGWRDQQVADLLVASRRTHDGHAGKALRRDYVVRTLAKAREAATPHAGEADIDAAIEKLAPKRGPRPVPVAELLADHPELREPVIHGLLRQGETMNVIAPSKARKSWLLLDLVTSLATGRPWLDSYPVEKGRVLILDNELHEETIASRIPRVAEARGVPLRDFASNVDVASLRGGLEDVLSLAPWVRRQEPGRWKLVVLDAFYRFMPADSDENDNGTMARVYNRLDAYARHLGCSFVLVHHATKGSQAGKAVTDVGAGAGAQSRATDTHLVLRPHEEEGCVVLDAAVRSWPPVEPRCLRWTFPVWNPDDSLDPEALKVEGRKRKREKQPAEPVVTWTPERFVKRFLGAEPLLRDEILFATGDCMPRRKAVELLRIAESRGLCIRRQDGPSTPVRFARRAR